MFDTISFTEGVIVGVLAAWLLITAVRQFSDNPRVWGWDVFTMVPRWTFFAPTPIRTDYSLLLRDHLRDGSAEPWRESPFVRRRVWWHLLCDPDSRCRHVVHLLARPAVTSLQPGTEAVLRQGRHASALLQAALSFPGSPDAQAREVVVIRSFGFVSPRLPQVVLRFGRHPIAAPARKP